ncbi:hypothetical protein F0562_003420 [Nyssa sinensis]|uniref:Uncharacterized protein n=1 Tax=Nyssa sinensis TaxID=561372 RepID=A0A5J5C0K3_9ASTE|nr:hypothetical protein F0562_003420 [Nyssa sinensis]
MCRAGEVSTAARLFSGVPEMGSEEPDEFTSNRAAVCSTMEAIVRSTNSTEKDLLRSSRSNHKLSDWYSTLSDLYQKDPCPNQTCSSAHRDAKEKQSTCPIFLLFSKKSSNREKVLWKSPLPSAFGVAVTPPLSKCTVLNS